MQLLPAEWKLVAHSYWPTFITTTTTTEAEGNKPRVPFTILLEEEWNGMEFHPFFFTI